MKLPVAILALCLALIGGIYYQFFYPPSAMKRRVAGALEEFAQTVATKDRAKIGEGLQQFLADDAKIRLEVTFFSLAQQNRPLVTQDFDKASFIRFIDNVLYPLTDYAYQPRLEELAEDGRHTAWVSNDWADGVNMYGGVRVGMRFFTQTRCAGHVVFTADRVQLKDAECKVSLRSAPRSG